MNNATNNNKSNIEFLREIPKPELHLHLFGAIRRATLEDLMQKYSADFPGKPEGFIHRIKLDKFRNLNEAFVFREFEDFLRLYILCMFVLREWESSTGLLLILSGITDLK